MRERGVSHLQTWSCRFLMLRGQHLCFPPTARTYPYLSTDAVPHRLKVPHKAVQYVGFNNDSLSSNVTTSAYLAARYESKRENTDFSLRDFLLGQTELNALKRSPEDEIDPARLERIVRDLKLAGSVSVFLMAASIFSVLLARLLRCSGHRDSGMTESIVLPRQSGSEGQTTSPSERLVIMWIQRST